MIGFNIEKLSSGLKQDPSKDQPTNMMLADHQRSAKVDLRLVLRRSVGGIGKKKTDHQWPATDGPTLMVHQWTASGQPLWFNTIGPPADQQCHLVLTVDGRKTDEQNSGWPPVDR
jgi:hypothetical protein